MSPDKPFIDNRVVCVVSADKPELAAEISSIFAREGYYFPLFIFPDVKTTAGEKHEHSSDGYLSAMIGNEAAVLIEMECPNFLEIVDLW